MGSFRSSAAYRIAAVYTAVFAWAILLLGAAAWFVADGEIRQQRDRGLVEELDRLANKLDRPALLRELALRQSDSPAHGFAYALFDRKGERIAGTPLEISRPPQGLNSLPMGGGDQGRRSLRTAAVDLADGSRLAVAASLDSTARIQSLIFQFTVAAFFFVLAVGAIGGLALGWYLRRRLKPISATADAIVTGDIEWRVPVGRRGDEFDAASHALNMMLDRIAGLMENLRQVSSDIAHDLRKPLIRLLLQTDRLGEVEGAQKQVLDLGDEMLALFAAILRIAEVEGGGLERGFTRVDLSMLMSEVAESFAPALADSGHAIDWTIEPDLTVMGNRELLAQLATNLLDNARIHTPAGTDIALRLASDGSDVRLVVEDNGPGVSEADRDKLLQRFFRAESSRTTPGNGLGLSLVAAVTGAHGGSVQIENAEPGLRVSVALPKAQAKSRVPPSSGKGAIVNGRNES